MLLDYLLGYSILLLLLELAFGIVWVIAFAAAKFRWHRWKLGNGAVAARRARSSDDPAAILRFAEKAGWSPVPEARAAGGALIEKEGLIVWVGPARNGVTELAFLGAAVPKSEVRQATAVVSELLGPVTTRGGRPNS